MNGVDRILSSAVVVTALVQITLGFGGWSYVALVVGMIYAVYAWCT